jgi:dipeptidyl aminopeptidase/acylaminoacyl peptidase
MTWQAISPDHRVTAVARTDAGRACIRVSGGRPDCHEAIALGDLVFSASGSHLAYPARDSGRWAMVRDGRPGPAWDGVASPVFSPDGARLAYAAQDGGAWRVVVNDTAGERFDSLFAGSIVFGAGGRRVGYVARLGDSAHAVVDGHRSPGWAGLARLTFSVDGAHVAFLARSDRASVLVVDGRAGAPHERIVAFALGPSGDRAAYAAVDGGRWTVVEGDRSTGPYDAVRSLQYVPAGDSPVWIARAEGRERVYRNGAPGPAWDSVGALAFAERGGRWGYLGHDSAGTAIVLDGRTTAREPWASNLVASADGARLAWLARRGDTSVVVDEHGTHPFDMLLDGSLQFLPDGRAWACLAGDRKRHRLFLVVEGVAEHRPFDWSENMRLLERDPTGAELVAWIGAEAVRMLEQDGRGK